MEMLDIVVRACCFVAIIFLGYWLRKIGFFKEGDFDVLAKIVLRITLPAAIVVSYSGREVSASMLILSVIGFAGGGLYMAVAYVMAIRASRERKAFEMLNMTGYNIGNFTMPFVRSFLGPTAVMATSLFDTGNAFICLGGAYSVASMVKGESGGFSLKPIMKKLVTSVPFDTYIIMAVLGLLHWSLPQPVVQFAGIIADGNAFMAMLMIGVGFKLSGSKEQIGAMVRILGVRYGIAMVLALLAYFVLPLPLEYRQTLAILVFAPVASAAPPYTAELKGDVGLSSAINSMSIVISIICIMITVLLVL